MKFQKSTFKHAIKFLLPAIGQNESRRNLMSLHIQTKQNACILTAANAYLIKRVYLELTTWANVKPFLIPGEDLPLFLQMMTPRRVEEISINRYMLKADEKSIRYKQPQVEFPNLDAIIEGTTKDGENIYDIAHNNGDTDFAIGVNANFFGDATSGFGPYDVMKMKVAGLDRPIRFETHDKTYISILMPVRLQW